MKLAAFLASLLLMLIAASGAALLAQNAAASPATVSAVEPACAVSQLIPLTVSQAWQLSGRNVRNFSQMVQELAELSARNRGVVLADTAAAGDEIGRCIKQNAQAYPNALLYSVVDGAVLDYKKKHPTGAGPATPTYSASQLMPLTVAQAWQLSGQNYANVTQMVKTLAEVSAQNRAICIADTKDAGAEIGKMIRSKAEADPDQLLYAVVDSSLVDYAAKTAK